MLYVSPQAASHNDKLTNALAKLPDVSMANQNEFANQDELNHESMDKADISRTWSLLGLLCLSCAVYLAEYFLLAADLGRSFQKPKRPSMNLYRGRSSMDEVFQAFVFSLFFNCHLCPFATDFFCL